MSSSVGGVVVEFGTNIAGSTGKVVLPAAAAAAAAVWPRLLISCQLTMNLSVLWTHFPPAASEIVDATVAE